MEDDNGKNENQVPTVKHSENDKDIPFVSNKEHISLQKPELIRGAVGNVNN